MPGDERRGVPAVVVIDRDHGMPVAEEGHALPLAPPSLFLRQVHGEVQVQDDCLILGHGHRQGNDQVSFGVACVVKGQRRLTEADLVDDQDVLFFEDPIPRIHAEQFQSLGGQAQFAASNPVVRMSVENDFLRLGAGGDWSR